MLSQGRVKMANVFSVKHYRKIAELIGKAHDLDEFYRLFAEFAKNENPKFNIEKFYNWVQKFHQYGGIGCGAPELAEQAQHEADEAERGAEQDGQPDEAQEWHDFDPDA